MAVSFPDAPIWLRHRDPRRLWPKLTALAVLLHGLVWLLGWPILLRSQPALTQSGSPVVPIELVDTPTDTATEAAVTAPSAETTSATEANTPAPSPSSTAPNPAIEPQPTDTQEAIEATGSSDISDTNQETREVETSTSGGTQTRDRQTTQDAVGQPQGRAADTGQRAGENTGQNTGDRPDRNTGDTGIPGENTNREDSGAAGSADTGAANTEETRDDSEGETESDDGLGTVNVSGSATGQNAAFVAQLSLAPTPDAGDIPGEQPTLMDSAPQLIELDPLQGTCTIENPATLRAIQAGTSVTLRITVEPDGQVSNAFVMNTSGDGGVDSLMQCLLVEDQTFKFNPAQSDGRIPAANADLTIAVTAN